MLSNKIYGTPATFNLQLPSETATFYWKVNQISPSANWSMCAQTTILKEDRDACVADTSKSNNSYYTSYPSPAGRALLCESSVLGKWLTVAVSFSMISLV